MSLMSDNLPILEEARELFDDLGFRQYSVNLVVVDWDGEAGDSNKTITETEIRHANGSRPACYHVTQRDILVSGGTYEDVDFVIGPMTPLYNDSIFGPGGVDIASFQPEDVPNEREVFYRISGPGLDPINGNLFKKISQEVDRNWSYYFTVRKTATKIIE